MPSSLPSPEPRGGAAQVAGPGHSSLPARVTWAGRPVPSRHAALPGWSGPSTGSGSEGPRWGGRAMAVPAAAALPCPLLLAMCWVVAAGTAAGRSGMRASGRGGGARGWLRSVSAGVGAAAPCAARAARTSLRAHANMDVREMLSFCSRNRPKLVSRVRGSASGAPCPAAYRERGC